MIAALLLAMQAHDHHLAPPPPGTVIRVEINPEARVSAERVGVLPPQRCDRPIAVPLSIDDQSRARTALTADSDAARVVVDRAAGVVMLTLARPMTQETSISFAAGPGTDDLAGRDSVTILVRCR